MGKRKQFRQVPESACLYGCGDVHWHLGTSSVNSSFIVRQCHQETCHFLPVPLFVSELWDAQTMHILYCFFQQVLLLGLTSQSAGHVASQNTLLTVVHCYQWVSSMPLYSFHPRGGSHTEIVNFSCLAYKGHNLDFTVSFIFLEICYRIIHALPQSLPPSPTSLFSVWFPGKMAYFNINSSSKIIKTTVFPYLC